MNSSEPVVVVATVVVAMATVVYAALTYHLLAATKRSAEASAKASEAASLAIRISNAQIVVNFDVEYVWQPPLMFLTITPRGANVEVIRVRGHFGKTGADGVPSAADEELMHVPDPDGPIPGDERMQYTWDSPKVHPEPTDVGHTACALITYRLTAGAPERTAWVGADMHLPRGWHAVPMPPGQRSITGP